ncbi:MAG: hypothetical protein ACREAU_00545 [Nitrosopumilaceae archaeon]
MMQIFNKCVPVCFAWLTEEQQNTLQGAEIQEAINTLRLERAKQILTK